MAQVHIRRLKVVELSFMMLWAEMKEEVDAIVNDGRLSIKHKIKLLELLGAHYLADERALGPVFFSGFSVFLALLALALSQHAFESADVPGYLVLIVIAILAVVVWLRGSAIRRATQYLFEQVRELMIKSQDENPRKK